MPSACATVETGMSMRSATELYEDDFFAWTQLQAKELRRFARTRPNLPLDLAHIAEEVADLGKSQRDSLAQLDATHHRASAPDRALPAEEPRRGWIDEIVELRSEIESRLTPTLQSGPEATAPAPLRSRTAETW